MTELSTEKCDAEEALIWPSCRTLGRSERPRLVNKRTGFAALLIVLLLWKVSMRTVESLAAIAPLEYQDVSRDDIKWSRCGDIDGHEVQCGTLKVPKDHFTTGSQSKQGTFQISLTRMLSKKRRASTQTILINPGGPGASGSEMLYDAGADLMAILDGKFDLMGFDPRGVNRSIPNVSCFAGSEDRLADFMTKPRDTSNYTRLSGDWFAYTQNFGKSCRESMGPDAAYINTPQTAADLVSILDAIHQQGLYYFGFSYGTLLGQTFAQLFPERAHRLVLDGVAAQSWWYHDDLALNNATDYGVEAWTSFLDECYAAGPTRCALSKDFPSAKAAEMAIVNQIHRLALDPLPVYLNASIHGSIQPSDVIDNIFSSLYAPESWNETASILHALVSVDLQSPFLNWSWQINDDAVQASDNHEDETRFLIALNDYIPSVKVPKTMQSRQEILASCQADQPVSTDMRALFRGDVCESAFEVAAWKYQHTHTYVPGSNLTTQHPILFLSTVHDPITSLAFARQARQDFRGSVLVVQNSTGHCTTSAPSPCSFRHIYNYFIDGTLPSVDSNGEAHCGIDKRFQYFPLSPANSSNYSHDIRAPDKFGEDFGIAVFEDRVWNHSISFSKTTSSRRHRRLRA